MSNDFPRFSHQSLKDKLNSYIPSSILNYDLSFMPNDTKKCFEKIFSQHEQIDFNDALDQDDERDQFKQFQDLQNILQEQTLTIKADNLMHFQYQWIFKVLKVRTQTLTKFNILDDLEDNSQNLELFNSQFLHCDLALYLLIQMNNDISKEQIDGQLHRIMIYDTFQAIVQHFLGFIQKFSKFLLGNVEDLKPNNVDQFQQINNLVGKNFSVWILKYLEQITLLLLRNEKLNYKELERIFIYVYVFLTVELIIFTYLSSNENLEQESLNITFELIQEPFCRLSNIFYQQQSSLDELCKIEAQFKKPFLWNYLLALTIFEKSQQYPSLALQLYDNFEQELDQSNGHFYQLFSQWMCLLFFTEIKSEKQVDDASMILRQKLFESHLKTLNKKQKYVIELLTNNNKEFGKILKKLIKKQIKFDQIPQFQYISQLLNQIKEQIVLQNQMDHILLFWVTFQNAIISLDDSGKNQQIQKLICSESPLILKSFQQFGLSCNFILEKSVVQDAIVLFRTQITYFSRFYRFLLEADKLFYLELINKFFKESLNFILKSETIGETLLLYSCQEDSQQIFFSIVAVILDLFDNDSTNRILVLSYFVKVVNKIQLNLVQIYQNLQVKLQSAEPIDILMNEFLYDIKLVSFICRFYSILGVEKKGQKKILYNHLRQPKDALYQSIQTYFNIMSVSDVYNAFYENGVCQKIQRILLQNKIYVESFLDFAQDTCSLVEKMTKIPVQYDARSFILMLTKEIINLQYVMYYNDETLSYYQESNANSIYKLTYKLVINTAYLINERADTIQWKDQIFHVLNQLMNLTVGRSFYYQVEQYVFYDDYQYIKKIDKDLRKKLAKYLEYNTENIQMQFILPKMFEMILCILFETPSDIEHKYYILTILDVILASSIQSIIQLHQILPKMIFHLRLETNSLILKMMSNSIQKIMYIKSDITSFKALFQAMGQLPSIILSPFVEDKLMLTQIIKIQEALQTPDHIIPLYNENQRKALSDIVSNENHYRQTLATLITIIKNVIQNNFGRQNQYYFTGQQSGIDLRSSIPLKKTVNKQGLSFQIVFMLKFEKFLFNQVKLKSVSQRNISSNLFQSNMFASSATLFPQNQNNQQILLHFSNHKTSVIVLFSEENQKFYIVIATQREKGQVLRHKFEMLQKKDYKSWLMIQIVYGKKIKGFGFRVYINGTDLKPVSAHQDDDLTQALQTIEVLNIGQDPFNFLPKEDIQPDNRSSSMSSQLSIIQYLQDDKMGEFSGFLDESQMNKTQTIQDIQATPMMNFAGQIQMFYFLIGDNDAQNIYQLLQKSKGQSKVFDDEMEKTHSGRILVKLNLNMYENQNIANYKQFLDPMFTNDPESAQQQKNKNTSQQLLIVNHQQNAQVVETRNLLSYFGNTQVKKNEDSLVYMMIQQQGVFYLDSYSIYDILLQFGHYELFYFVFFLLFRVENSENLQKQNKISEEIFVQTLLMIDNIIEHFKELNIISFDVDECHSNAYMMINFLISGYLKKPNFFVDRNQILLEDKQVYLQEIYKKLLEHNKDLKDPKGQKGYAIDFNISDERLLHQWKSLFSRMTSQIGLWNFLNQDTLEMQMYLTNIIMKDDEFMDQTVQIHQHRYKVNKLEDKLRRKFYLKIDKKWSDKPYSLNVSYTTSTNITQSKNLVEDDTEIQSPINPATSLDSSKYSRKLSMFNLGPSFLQLQQSIQQVQVNMNQSQDMSDLKLASLSQGDQSQQSISLKQSSSEDTSEKSKVILLDIAAEMITPKGGYWGKLIITTKSIYFQNRKDKPEDNEDLLIGCIPEMSLPFSDKKKEWMWSNIKEVKNRNYLKIHDRRFLLSDVAIEIFTKSGKSYFFNLFKTKTKLQVFDTIKSLNPKHLLLVQNRKEHFKKKQYTEKWIKGEISNFNYLMQINSSSGRSFNDINQYFVFPWILNQYESEEIKLNKSSTIYRDLGKAVGALNDERFSQFKERYKTRDEGDEESDMIYGTHYSHSTIILSYLMRLEPYAILHHQLQGGKFDIPDRLFHSMSSLFQTSLQSDVKELIPEFFYMPDFLQNKNKLDLGLKQNADKVDDVELPKWVKTRTSEEFIFIMRQSLENTNVSKNLHKWINLVFGYQNQGKEALEADNLFHFITYQKNAQHLLSQKSSLAQFKSRIAQITFYGQTPYQIFDSPHPIRNDQKGQIFQDFNWNLDMTTQFFDLKSEIINLFHAPFVGLYAVLKDFSLQFISWDRQISSYIIMNDATPKLKKESLKLGQPTYLFNNPSQIMCFISSDIQPLFDFHALRDFSISNQYKLLKSTQVSIAIGGYDDNSFRIYNTKTNQYVSYKFHKRLVTCIMYCPIDQILVVGSSDCRVSIWKVNLDNSSIIPQTPHLTLYGHHNQVTAVQASGTLNIIVSADWNGMILIYHFGGRLLKCIRQPLCLKEAIVQICIHEGGFILTRTSTSLINVFTINGAKYVTNWTVEDPQENITKLMLLSPLQGHFMVVTSSGRTCICDIFNIKFNQEQTLIVQPNKGQYQNQFFTQAYKDYEIIDYHKMKIANVGGDEINLKQITNDRYKDFQQVITTCWVNIEIEVKYSNLILILGMQDGKIYVFQNQEQSFTDLKRIKAGFKSLGL